MYKKTGIKKKNPATGVLFHVGDAIYIFTYKNIYYIYVYTVVLCTFFQGFRSARARRPPYRRR